tara:strand:+ start:80 stop:664 length:585 start_codon:yes stop_codon:yes gene_type:complete
MNLNELNKAFKDFGDYMVVESQKNLKEKGKGGGPLYNSLSSKVINEDGKVILNFYMENYGEFVDKGVKGADPSKLSSNAQKTGQQAPNSPYKFGSGSSKGTWKDFVRSVSAWAQIKNIRLREYTYKDGIKKSTGKFAKGNYETIGQVIAKNIYNRGIKPSFFYTKPFNKAFKDLPNELFDAFAIEVTKGIKIEN